MKSNLNIIFSILNVGVSAIQSLWLLSYIQNIMGVEAYGYISVITAVVNMGNIITLAFTTFTSRFVTVNLHRGEVDKANEYFNSSLFGLLIATAISCICFLAFAKNINVLLGVTQEYVEQVRLLLFFVSGSFLLNSLSVPFKAGVYYSNKVYIMHALQIGGYLSRILATLIMYNAFVPQIWFAYFGSFIFDFGTVLFYFLYYKKLMPGIRLSKRFMSIKATKEILTSGIWVSINKAGASLLTTINTYLINIIVSVYMTGIYSTITQFVSFVGMLTMALVSCFVPTIYKLYAENNKTKLYEYITYSTKILSVSIGVVVGGLIVFERYLLTLMINDVYMDYTILIILTLIEIPFTYPTNIIEQVLITYNKFTIPAISQLVSGIVNVGIIYMIYVVAGADVYTIVLVTCSISIIRNLVFLPIYNQIVTYYKLITYYRQVVKGVLANTITIVLGYISINFLKPDSWFKFIILVLAVGILAGGITFRILFNKPERTKFTDHLALFLRR